MPGLRTSHVVWNTVDDTPVDGATLNPVSSNWAYDHTATQAAHGASGRTATYVVAASDAPAHVKAQADYVCDGTADDVQIQAAIDALPANGGLVQLTGGQFNISATIVPIANLWLQGTGKGITVIYLSDGSDCDMIGVTAALTRVSITNLTLNGNKLNQSAGNGLSLSLPVRMEIVNIEVTDTFSTGISLTGQVTPRSERIYARNCEVRDAGGDGFFFGNTKELIVDSCSSIGSGDTGIVLQNAIESAEVTGCRVSGSTFAGLTLYFTMYVTRNISVADCISENNGTSGFYLYGAELSECTISSSIARGNTVNGFYANNVGQNCRFLNCESYKNEGIGFSVENSEGFYIQNSNAWANGTNGFTMYTTKHSCVINCVSRNNLAYGIDTSGSTYLAILGNSFTDTQAGITSNLAVNATSGQKNVTVVSGTSFFVYQSVTISDTSNSENNVIASISGNVLTMQTNLAHTYVVADSGKVDGRATQTKGIQTNSNSYYFTMFDNDLRGNINPFTGHHHSTMRYSRNIGYIGQGEIRSVSIAITAGAQNTVTSIQNTFGGDVFIIEANVMISTAATGGNPTYDMGTDDDGAGAPSVANNLFEAIPDTVGYYSSRVAAGGGTQTIPVLWQKTGNDWVNFIITDDSGVGVVGTIYLTVMGK